MKWCDKYEPYLKGKCIIGPVPNKEKIYWTCLEYDSIEEAKVNLLMALFHYHSGTYAHWQQNEAVAKWAIVS